MVVEHGVRRSLADVLMLMLTSPPHSHITSDPGDAGTGDTGEVERGFSKALFVVVDLLCLVAVWSLLALFAGPGSLHRSFVWAWASQGSFNGSWSAP